MTHHLTADESISSLSGKSLLLPVGEDAQRAEEGENSCHSELVSESNTEKTLKRADFCTGETRIATGLSVQAQSAESETPGAWKKSKTVQGDKTSITNAGEGFFRPSLIIQPNLLLSYSFVHTFAHKNGMGNRVSSSPLNAIQVAPDIKFIANLKNGWQPYINLNMRWNIMDKTSFNLPDVNIPDMSIRPYFEYGVGLQKRWGERFTDYGQAMLRNGVMLSVGFRWALGK